MTEAAGKAEAGWIDIDKMDKYLSDKIEFISCVDGSEHSMRGFELVLKGLMQKDRETMLDVVHVYDDSKDYLPPKWRKDQIEAVVTSQCVSYLKSERYNFVTHPKPAGGVKEVLLGEIERKRGDYVVMGYYGRKGSKKSGAIASNVMAVMSNSEASCIIMQKEDEKDVPINRPTKFVVSVSLNAAATKAFIDALRLSKPGDEIHVIYIKSYMERTESDYTRALREKYDSLFAGLKGGGSEVVQKFGDRSVLFKLVPKQMRETTSQAVARYADEVDADFVVVGTNTLRTSKGKSHLGSVSMQILVETDKNFIVANYTPADQAKGGDIRQEGQ